MKIPFPDIRYLTPVLLLIGFTLISRFLIVIPLSLAGRTNFRNSFIASLNLAQISEFSLVIVALGVEYKHISKETMGAVLFAMSFTSIVSAYLIKYNHQIFLVTERLLHRAGILKVRKAIGDENSPEKGRAITILGYHRGAQALIEFISIRRPELLKDLMVIDINLESVRELSAHHIAHYYGDFAHADTLLHAGVADTRIIVSSIPDLLLRGTSNLKITQMCRKLNKHAFIIANADTNQQIIALRQAGANEVLLPYFEAAAHLTEILLNISGAENIAQGAPARNAG